MSLSKKVSLIIYRFRERGLEVFLVNNEEKHWEIPQGELETEHSESIMSDERTIELDPVKHQDGEEMEALAVEGEWHDIPSLKGMLIKDAAFLKDKFKEMEQGTFITVKDAFKKVLPHQYAFLKELKEVLRDRNSLKNL